MLGDLSEQPGRPASGGGPLLDRQQAVGAGHRFEHGVEIERTKRAQIDHLGVDAVLLGELLGGGERVGHALADGRDREILSLRATRACPSGMTVSSESEPAAGSFTE